MEAGARVGRYVVLHDADGLRHAIALSAAIAVLELAEGGCVLLIPGGRMVRLESSLEEVLEWFNR